ncbi:hypothetical protein [Streptomyces nanshensis]|uniref:hypothetical protein n=1 Tax=Streptomyces nanshensis TaxID=518642 RepID=UPI00085C8721|nr:hypothetical protein [Streptomyces nanshensis]
MLPVLRILFSSAVAVTLLASTLGPLLSYYRMADAGFVLILVALGACWLAVPLGLVVSSMTKRQRRERYERAYPNRDALVQHLDSAAIRAVRDSNGLVHAIRALRKQVPDVPIADARAVVESL